MHFSVSLQSVLVYCAVLYHLTELYCVIFFYIRWQNKRLSQGRMVKSLNDSVWLFYVFWRQVANKRYRLMVNPTDI